MLHKSAISAIQIYTPEWDKMRCGKFTSSKINCLMAERKELSEGALTYIQQKAGEFITGLPAEPENEQLEDEYTLWGLEHEPEALRIFGEMKELKYLVVQKLIHIPGSRFSSTPDALWIIDSSVMKEDCYNVASVEVKCPRKYPRFFPLYNCKTPADLKAESKQHYWQVLDQMDNCSSPIGYYVVFHPLFPPKKNIRIIEFRKIDLWEDFSKLQRRKQLAVNQFNEIVAQFIS